MWLPVSLRIFDSFTVESRSPGGDRAVLAAGSWCGGGCRRCGRGAAAGAAARGSGAPAAGAAAAGAAVGGGCVRHLVDVVEHVVAGDAPARAGALDEIGVDVVLGDEAAHDGRQQAVVGRRSVGLRRGVQARRRQAVARRAPAGASAGGWRRRLRRSLARERVAGSSGGAGSGSAGAGASAAGPAASGSRGAGASAAGASAAGARASAAGAGASAPAASPTTAITAPTGTVSPSCTRISVTVPAIGDGTSVSTLSVLTSNNGSSAETLSPTFLNQRVIVPSVTVSPSCGNVTSAMVWSLSSIGSGVQAAARERQYGFAEQFCQAGVRLDELGDFGRRGFPVDGKIAAAQLLGDPRAHHVHAEDLPGAAVGLLLGDDLHQTVELAEDLRPAVGTELMLGDDHVVAGFACCFFARSRERDLGVAVDRPRHPVVGNGFGFSPRMCLVTRMASAYPTCASCGVLMMSPMAYTPGSPVRQYSSTSMKPRSVTLTAVPVRPSLSANGRRPTLTTTSIDFEVLDLRRSRAEVHGAAGAVGCVAEHLDTGADVDVLLLEAAHDDVGDVAVESGKDLRQAFEDRHLRTEVGERAGELASDRAATDHRDACGHVVEHQHLVTGHDGARRLEAGDGARHRTGGQHHVLATDGRRALRACDGDGAVRHRACRCRR